MTPLRWVLFVLMSAFSGLITIGNWGCPMIAYREKRNVSIVPLIGGLSGCLVLLLSPIQGAARFWWAPLLLDLGCVPMLLLVVVFLIREKFSRNQP
jgi:hypothetical protein